jgi:hypothetical protein
MAVQLVHRRLVLVAREERVGVGGRAPQRDQGVVGAVREVVAADETRRRGELLHEPCRREPEPGGPLLVGERGLQDEQRAGVLGPEVAVGTLLGRQHGRGDAYALDGGHAGDDLDRRRLGQELDHGGPLEDDPT